MRPLITGLGDYGLTLADLEKLASPRLVYSIGLRGVNLEMLVPLRPRDRSAALAEHLRRSLSSIERRHSFDSLAPCDAKKPWWSDAVSGVQTFLALSRSQLVSYLILKRIPGMRKRHKPAPPPSFFTVRARVAIQIEGQTSGLQTVEDRFVIVKARSFKDAERRLKAEWERYAQPYLNPEGELVRWQLEEVTDVYDVMEATIDPKGTEVYSSFSDRRVKPEYEWRVDHRHDRARKFLHGGINRR